MRAVRVVAAILIANAVLLGGGRQNVAGIAVAEAQQGAGSGATHEPTRAGGVPAGETDIVIPAGQENLLGDMLGREASLPDGCQLVNGDIEYRIVKALYKCPAGEVVVELDHPSRAAKTSTRTDQFAITVQSGSPPDSLVPALVSRIRSRETDFEWQVIEPPKQRPSGHEHGSSPGQPISWVRLALAALFVITILGWIVRRRSAAKKAT